MLRIGDAICEIIVVRQDQQAACVLIQSADRSYPLANIGKEIVHRGSAFGIAICRNVPLGLVKQEIDLFLLHYPFAVQRDTIVIKVDPHIGCSHNLPVHGHPS